MPLNLIDNPYPRFSIYPTPHEEFSLKVLVKKYSDIIVQNSNVCTGAGVFTGQ
jgi:hypothetical protein